MVIDAVTRGKVAMSKEKRAYHVCGKGTDKDKARALGKGHDNSRSNAQRYKCGKRGHHGRELDVSLRVIYASDSHPCHVCRNRNRVFLEMLPFCSSFCSFVCFFMVLVMIMVEIEDKVCVRVDVRI